MSSSNHSRLESGFIRWISQQRTDLDELLHVLTVVPDGDAELLRRLAQKNIQHLNDFQHTRGGDALSIFSASWCSSFENSLFWIGGFKPSIYIRLVYSMFEIDSEKFELKLSKLFNGERTKCGEYSGTQMKLIKALHANTLSTEEKISSRLADLQECITIEPLVAIANNNNYDHEVDRAMAAHGVALGGIVFDADELRVTVLKELIFILTPIQGIHLLVASNRLHLSIHEWGKN